MAKMNENLTSLNDMYEGQLQQMQQNKELFSGMGELVKNLNDSVEDTKVYKEISLSSPRTSLLSTPSTATC